MKLPSEPATPAQEIARLQRELAHVSQQAVVSHGMAMRWRQRALQAEEQLRRLQHKYDRLRGKQEQPQEKAAKPVDPADQLLSWELGRVEDAEVPV